MGSFKLGKMTFRSLFKKPETILYPFEKKDACEGLAGTIRIDESNCILCGICSKRCPCSAISVSKDEGTWSIIRHQCVQCGFCVSECPKKCLFFDTSLPSINTEITQDTYSVHLEKKSNKSAIKQTSAKQNETSGKADVDAVFDENTAPTFEPTGDPEFDDKLAKLPPEKAAILRAAYLTKKEKQQEKENKENKENT